MTLTPSLKPENSRLQTDADKNLLVSSTYRCLDEIDRKMRPAIVLSPEVIVTTWGVIGYLVAVTSMINFATSSPMKMAWYVSIQGQKQLIYDYGKELGQS